MNEQMSAVGGNDDHVWYFAYAGSMNAASLSEQIGAPTPRQSCTAVAEDAWLSFDYCGIPFVEPAYASLIIKGFNDSRVGVKGRNVHPENDPEYRRYIHDRCFPGIPFTEPGEIPPPVEGVAYEVTASQMEALASSSGFRVAEVRCQRLSSEQQESHSFPAYCLVAEERLRSSRLMPTITAYAAVYRGALTNNLSLRYMRHLVQLRPYNLAHASRGVRFARGIFVGLVLIPQFLTLYLPIALTQKLLRGVGHSFLERLKLLASDVIRFNAILAERIFFRPFIGRAAYAIDY